VSATEQLILPGTPRAPKPKRPRAPKRRPVPGILPEGQVRSVSDNQSDILLGIMKLYCPSGFEVDATYGGGGFYRDGRVPVPRLLFDLAPRQQGIVQADCRRLPLERRSVGSVLFDPPFLHHGGKNGVMQRLYSSYHNQRELLAMYEEALGEFHRVLQLDGVLTFKCQDVIEAGQQRMTHCEVWRLATAAGFDVLDLFVLLAKSKIGKWPRQLHARKWHSYFWCLQKPCRARV